MWLNRTAGGNRSTFLIKSGLSKEAYIATGVAIACVVDLSRLSVYASRFKDTDLNEHLSLVISATAATIDGAFIGNRLLKKVTIRFIQVLVSIMLVFISIAMGAGII